jgi:hypothetical protein
VNCRMRRIERFEMFLDRLTHNDQPSEAQSPIQASAVAALVSFLFVFCLDGRLVSSLGVWWAQLLVYAFVPVLLAFIILYRSSWHREFAAGVRTFLAALMSCIIFVGVLLAITVAMVLVTLAYYSHFDNISRFHY